MSKSGLIPVAKVVRPHGLRGLLRIMSYSGVEASFTDAEIVYLRLQSGEIRRFTVISINAHKNSFLMDVAEINSPDEAEACRGAELLVEKEALKREEEAYFWHELLGLEVYTDTGDFIGRISHIMSTGANDIYVVQKGEEEIYIPAIVQVIKKIDLEEGRIIISPMEGLLDLNAV